MPLSISAPFRLPDGRVILCSFEGRNDTRLNTTIGFELTTGEIVTAKLVLDEEQVRLLAKLHRVEVGGGLGLEQDEIGTAYRLHELRLAMYSQGRAWVTYEGRRWLAQNS